MIYENLTQGDMKVDPVDINLNDFFPFLLRSRIFDKSPRSQRPSSQRMGYMDAIASSGGINFSTHTHRQYILLKIKIE
jgi:hypothetical protein